MLSQKISLDHPTLWQRSPSYSDDLDPLAIRALFLENVTWCVEMNTSDSTKALKTFVYQIKNQKNGMDGIEDLIPLIETYLSRPLHDNERARDELSRKVLSLRK